MVSLENMTLMTRLEMIGKIISCDFIIDEIHIKTSDAIKFGHVNM